MCIHPPMLLFYLHYPLHLYPLSELSSSCCISFHCNFVAATNAQYGQINHWNFDHIVLEFSSNMIKPSGESLQSGLQAYHLRPYDLCFWVMKVSQQERFKIALKLRSFVQSWLTNLHRLGPKRESHVRTFTPQLVKWLFLRWAETTVMINGWRWVM